MGGGIDTARQPRHHRHASFRQLRAESAGEVTTRRARRTSADDANAACRTHRKSAASEQHRGCGVITAQRRRILGVIDEENPHVACVQCRSSAFEQLGCGLATPETTKVAVVQQRGDVIASRQLAAHRAPSIVGTERHHERAQSGRPHTRERRESRGDGRFVVVADTARGR